MLQALHLPGIFHRRLQQADVRNSVHPVVGHIEVGLRVGDEVIPAICCHQLVRVDHVLLGVSLLIHLGAELMIHPCMAVVKADLPALFHGLVQHVDGVEQLAVVRPVLRQGGDVPHPGSKVLTGEPLQLLYQLPTLSVRDVLGKQQPVDEDP